MRVQISIVQKGLAAALCLLGTVSAKAQVSTRTAPTVAPIFMPPTSVSSGTVSSYAWTGSYFTNSFVGAYIGGLVPFNRNLGSEGPLLRIAASGGRYSADFFSSSSSVASENKVSMLGGEVLLGYRKKFGEGWLTGYLGGAFENHDNPDPTASIRGSQGGGKGVVEYWGPLTQNVTVYGTASYSTVFETWSAFGRVGYKVADKVTIGSEGSLFGNNAPYREARIGPFITVGMPFGEVSVSGGYRAPTTPGADGYYVNIFFGYEFH